MRKIKADFWTFFTFQNNKFKLFGWKDGVVIKDYSGVPAKKLAFRLLKKGLDVRITCGACGERLDAFGACPECNFEPEI